MNILHMKYAVEVARLGSLNKVAETLLVAQPNISRSIKELEADLGITIFRRSAKGMLLTPEGEEFIRYAQSLLKQIDEVERFYKQGAPRKQRFSVCVPRASYISEAFSRFSASVGDAPIEMLYMETGSQGAIHKVLNSDYNLGIVRYSEDHDSYFKEMLEEKGLAFEMVAEFSYVLLMSRSHPLAEREEITPSELSPYIEIAHADPDAPTLPLTKAEKDEIAENGDRRIFVFERASQFDILAENPQAYMWVSPVSKQLLDRYGLVQKRIGGRKTVYKDMLIYREGYRLSASDKQFITALCETRRAYVK